MFPAWGPERAKLARTIGPHGYTDTHDPTESALLRADIVVSLERPGSLTRTVLYGRHTHSTVSSTSICISAQGTDTHSS